MKFNTEAQSPAKSHNPKPIMDGMQNKLQNKPSGIGESSITNQNIVQQPFAENVNPNKMGASMPFMEEHQNYLQEPSSEYFVNGEVHNPSIVQDVDSDNKYDHYQHGQQRASIEQAIPHMQFTQLPSSPPETSSASSVKSKRDFDEYNDESMAPQHRNVDLGNIEILPAQPPTPQTSPSLSPLHEADVAGNVANYIGYQYNAASHLIYKRHATDSPNPHKKRRWDVGEESDNSGKQKKWKPLKLTYKNYQKDKIKEQAREEKAARMRKLRQNGATNLDNWPLPSDIERSMSDNDADPQEDDKDDYFLVQAPQQTLLDNGMRTMSNKFTVDLDYAAMAAHKEHLYGMGSTNKSFQDGGYSASESEGFTSSTETESAETSASESTQNSIRGRGKARRGRGGRKARGGASSGRVTPLVGEAKVKKKVPAGLQNRNKKMCFMNSSVQAFYHTAQVHGHFMTMTPGKEMLNVDLSVVGVNVGSRAKASKANSRASSEGPSAVQLEASEIKLKDALARVMQTLSQNPKQTHCAGELCVLSHFKLPLDMTTDQDPNEYMMKLDARLSEEDEHIMDRAFGLVSKETTKCANCDKETTATLHERAVGVSILRPDGTPIFDLEEALEAQFEPIQISRKGGEGQDGAPGGECDCTEAIKTTKVTVPPNNLRIGLGRTDAFARKIGHQLRYPARLDIAKYTEDGSLTEYELYSVIAHLGKDARTGHFTAMCKNGEGWWLINDNKARSITEAEALDQKSAYVLFYRKVEPTASAGTSSDPA